tara:strand:+ start:309 stop:722 length:414 start_codon:yes stop_codon:yes gene_type:complete
MILKVILDIAVDVAWVRDIPFRTLHAFEIRYKRHTDNEVIGRGLVVQTKTENTHEIHIISIWWKNQSLSLIQYISPPKPTSIILSASSAIEKYSWMMDFWATVDMYLQRNDTNKVFRMSSIAMDSGQTSSDVCYIFQ